MKNIKALLVVFVLAANSMYSQGGWDIKYNSVNLLNNSFIDQPIWLDFKLDQNDTIDTRTNDSITAEDRFFKVLEVRQLLSRFDEFQISIGNSNLTFIETWVIDVDQGFLSNQRYFNKENDEEFIRNVTLIAINGNLLTFTGFRGTSNTNLIPFEFVVSKNDVKGFLTIR